MSTPGGRQPKNVEQYIEAAPPASQPLLRELRSLISSEARGVAERISYGMPTYDYAGRRLCHFAGYEGHVGLYGLIHEESALAKEAGDYLESRSTLRFDIGKPLPTALIRKAVKAKLAAVK